MAYIGYPISLEETIHLTRASLKKEGFDPDKIHCEEELNKALKKFSDLRMVWIDKNQTIFGLEVKDLVCQFWQPLLTVDNAVILILEGKRRFKQEVDRLNLDLSTVTFCHMEEEDTLEHNPEPLFFAASF